MIRPMYGLMATLFLLLPATVLALGGDEIELSMSGSPFAHLVTAGGHHIVGWNNDDRITLRRSIDGGLNWTTWTMIGNDTDDRTTFHGEDAVLVTDGIDRMGVLYRQEVRNDDGETTYDTILLAWAPVDAANPTWSPVGIDAAFAETFGGASLVTDEVSFSPYYIYVAYERDESNGRDIWFARSVDQGASFETPYLLAESTTLNADYYDPDVTYGYGGWVHVAWIEQTGTLNERHAIYRGGFNRGTPGSWDTAVTRLGTGALNIGCAHPRLAARVGAGGLMFTTEITYHGAGVTTTRVLYSANNGRDWSLAMSGTPHTNVLPFVDDTGLALICRSTHLDQIGYLRPQTSDPVGPWSFTPMMPDGIPVLPPAIDPTRGNRTAAIGYGVWNNGWTSVFDAEWFGDPGYGITIGDLPDADGDACLIDLDGDGADEIVVSDGASDELRAYTMVDGTFQTVPGFPVGVPIGPSGIWGQIAAGDVNGNGQAEVFVCSYTGVESYDSEGQLRPGWPFTGGDGPAPKFVSLGRVSNYARLDVVVAGPSDLWLLRSDGSVRAGFPRTYPSSYGAPVGPATITDVDDDGDTELVVTLEHAIVMYGPTGALESIIWLDTAQTLEQRAIGIDFDNDWSNGTELAFVVGSQVHLRRYQGYSVSSDWPWSQPQGYPIGPLAGFQVFGDFRSELGFSTDAPGGATNWFHILSNLGTDVPGLPFDIGPDRPSAEPVNGYLHPEGGHTIFQTTVDGTVHGLRRSSGAHEGWPRETGSAGHGGGFGDFDGDGHLELVIGGSLRVFEGDGRLGGNSNNNWHQTGSNAWRTGTVYGEWTTVSAIPEESVSASRFQFRGALPNPAGGATTFHFSLPDPGVAEVRVFDVRGREVRTLLRAELEPGAHQVYWDGRDDGGRDVASGVYLAQVRLTSGGRHDQQVRKVLVTH